MSGLDFSAPQHEETPEQLRERMRELGRRGAEARWRKDAERKAAIANGTLPAREGTGAAVDGLTELLAELAHSPKQPGAVRVRAAEALKSWGGPVAKPRSTQELEAMDDVALDALVARLEPAHGLPVDVDPAPPQG